MAPVTATSTGVARQTIDDLNLIALIERLSKFDTVAVAATADAVDAGFAVIAAAEATQIDVVDGDVSMADVDVAAVNVNDDDDDDMMAMTASAAGVEESDINNNKPPPPLDIQGLVAELDSVPKWQFQELADLYEWIRPLNAMDAALNYFMDAYPSLLLQPREKKVMKISGQGDVNNNKVNNLSSEQQQQQQQDPMTSPPLSEKDNKDPKSRMDKGDIKSTLILPPPPQEVIHSILSILRFQSQLLRNATSKFVYNSVVELSDLLSSSEDEIAACAIETLAALAVPPALHRQQAPEISQHTTALHRSSSSGGGGGIGMMNSMNAGHAGAASNTSTLVMSKLLGLSRGWGTKGTGLGLLQCVTMDDSSLGMMMRMTTTTSESSSSMENSMMEEKDGGNDDGTDTEDAEKERVQLKKLLESQKQQAQSILKCAGEISFECYLQTAEDVKDSSPWKKGRLVSLYVPKEDMFTSSASSVPPTSTTTTTTTSSSSSSTAIGQERQPQAEKRRRIANDLSSNTDKRTMTTTSATTTTSSSFPPKIKSTSQIYHECLNRIAEQLSGEDPSTVLSSEQLFTLLSSIRLARSFHSSSSRIAAIERRLRALACFVHSNPNQESVCAYFLAQPELCGELVDLLRPTVSSGNIACGAAAVAVPSENGVKLLEEEEVTTVSDVAGVALGRGGQSSSPPPPPTAGHINSILALSDSPEVPYTIRTLAIETLTALVARRDGAGTLTNVARQTNVLSELGVGKGQYLGLLPTLIRYSLASLNSFLLHQGGAKNRESGGNGGVRNPKLLRNDIDGDEADRMKDLGLELGLAFLKATKPPPLPLREREERALEFIDSVLTLTSAVISVPSGTASLTDCGIIPALVSSIALDGQIARTSVYQDEPSSPFASSSTSSLDESYSDCLLKFISAQAIQILEGAIVTHNSALSAFHELKGVDILVQRLSVEIERIKFQSGEHGNSVGGDRTTTTTCEDASAMDTGDHSLPPGKQQFPQNRKLKAARRVLLFSAVNCLTVVFHQQESGSNNPTTSAALSGAAQLRKPELQKVLLEIMENVHSYGGVLAALVATFLSDVMNSDPQVVHHVHSSGLAKSFLSLLMRADLEATTVDWEEPILNPSAELIMVLPNVIMALSLTEAGEAAVAEANPFPALMSIFCSPKYAIPNSRCLLNEMAAMIGTGLDEIMRHNPNLKTKCLEAVVQVIKRVVSMGRNLTSDEDSQHVAASNLENSRTILMQYVYNVVQILEQILHVEDHIAPFVAVGGFESLLELACFGLMPGGRSLVAHLTCLSSPSITSSTYSTTFNTLSVLVKTICSHTKDPGSHLKRIISQLESELHILGDCVATLSEVSAVGTLDCKMVLGHIPAVAIYDITGSPDDVQHLCSLSRLFRSLINVDWLTNCLATGIRTASQRVNEFGTIVGHEQEWKKVIDSKSFETLVDRLSLLHRSSLFEICRIRAEPGFDDKDAVRSRASDHPLVYKIRIVCQEGAIVRNGIDIDRCESVGNIEMGEIVYAYDRCINSSGVLRYRTSRGWVSELARGHGRENITEVLDVSIGANLPPSDTEVNSKRIECGVPDLRSAAATVMARLYGSQSNLFSSLEKIMSSGIRMPQRSLAVQQNGIPSYIISATKLLTSNLMANFDYISDNKNAGRVEDIKNPSFAKDAATCMYFGNQLSSLQSSLYEEKREEPRRIFNLPLLINLLVGDGWNDGIFSAADKAFDDESNSKSRILSAIHFVLMHSLRDMAHFAAQERVLGQKPDNSNGDGMIRRQRMSRAVASSLPPTLSLLRNLFSRSLLVESQVASVLTKMRESDFASLITNFTNCGCDGTSSPKFRAPQFARALHLKLAKIVHEIWADSQFACVPSHIMHPWIQLIGEAFRSLEEAGKVVDLPTTRKETERLRDLTGVSSRSNRILASMGVLQDPMDENPREQRSDPFEPSEDSISRLADMGFGREHAIEALESAGTNQVELAMEYALLRPPPSPATIERRRVLRQGGQGSLEQQEQNESRTSSSNDELAGDDVAQHQPPDAEELTASKGSSDKFETRTLSTDESSVKKGKDIEEKLASEAGQYLEIMKESSYRISLNIVEGCDVRAAGDTDSWQLHHDAICDSQGVIIIISNFLLDCCRLYPSLDSTIGSELLRRLKLCLEDPRRQSKANLKIPSHCQVKIGHETGFAAIVHASVVFFRALPKLRPLVLRNGIVGMITHCVRNCTLASSPHRGDVESRSVWPVWLAPALLLLEVMATPTSITLDEEGFEEGGVTKLPNKKSEYAKVLSEHKSLHRKQVSTLKHVFSTVINNKDAGKITPKKNKDSGEKLVDTPAGVECDHSPKDQSASLPQLPPFLPLLHTETQEACMLLCLQLLGLKTKKGVIDQAHLKRVCPPPIILNALLLLLVRLLRSRHLSSLCLQRGGADVLLRLPASSFFPGNKHIVSVALRRMLEDEATLHAMMETEIRSVVTKIYRKQHPSHSALDQPKINLKTFMRACAPLVCRDPSVFVKAFATTVKIDSFSEANLSSSFVPQVALLSTEERGRNTKLLGSHFVRNVSDACTTEKHAIQVDPSGRMMRGRSKSPHRSLTAKSPKSILSTKSVSKNHLQLNGTSANHISFLLLNEIMSEPEIGTQVETFLKPTDYLDILSDLVLAVPACGAALLRYKPKRGFCNAISGCPDPPQTAVSYILHKIISLPRLTSKQDLGRSFTDSEKVVRLQDFSRTTMSQAGARLIVCLIARSGEGRRSVVADLVFALRCGSLLVERQAPISITTKVRDGAEMMWAVSTWGDLVYGLSAPRSSNNSLISQDLNSTLSFGVVKMMMEHGIARALMAAIERIDLHHPMASSVASSIIRALEIYTRGSVITTVNEMQLREKEKAVKMSKEPQRVTFESSQRNGSQIYEAVLEDDFDGHTVRRHLLGESNSLGESVDDSSNEDVDESMDEDSDGSSEIEGHVDFSDDSNDDESSSGEEVSSDGSSEDDDESIDESDGEVVDDDDSLLADETEEDEGEEEPEGDEESHEDFLFDVDVDDEEHSGLENEAVVGNEGLDDVTEGGWTRIDNSDRSALGSMLLDMVQPHHSLGRQHHLANGGFLMDAAATMRNILRGDIGLEGLSEFEDSLGIRLIRGDRGEGRLSTGAGVFSAGLTNRASSSGLAGNVRPAVHQFSISTTLVSSNRHRFEMSPMEVVYGAPATGAGIQDHGFIMLANEEDHGRDSDIPSTYDTHLFPGGISLSTQFAQILVRNGAFVHPLIQSLSLPPVTSISSAVSTLPSLREGRNSTPDRNNLRHSAGSFSVDANGSIIRGPIRAEAHDGSRINQSMLNGSWADDGLPLEDFSSSFGQALNTFVQDEINSQNRMSASGPFQEGQTEPLIRNQESENGEVVDEVDGVESPAEDNNMVDAGTTTNQPPVTREAQSETAEVSCAMATGLSISQPALEPPRPINQTHPTTDGADVHVEAAGGAGEQAQDDDAIPGDFGADPRELNEETDGEGGDDGAPEEFQLTCPPDIDPDVFSSLPIDMQHEIIQQHEVSAQITESGLDPEALAALPEDLRREIIEEQNQQRLREEQSSQVADPANVEEMDNASFLASLAPDLRQEILLTADDAFISTLPVTLIAEANVLRERFASQQRHRVEENNGAHIADRPAQQSDGQPVLSRGRRQRNGKMRIESDRNESVWMEPLLTTQSAKSFLSLLYLLSPIHPQRVVHKLMLNLCLCDKTMRIFFLNALLGLLHNERPFVLELLKGLDSNGTSRPCLSAFPPSSLIGSLTDMAEERSVRPNVGSFRRRPIGNSAMTVAASLPASARGSSKCDGMIPPVVARRIIACFSSLCKASPRVAFSMLVRTEEDCTDGTSCLDKLLDLLEMNQYSQSASNLEQLLGLLEIVVAPMSLLPKDEQEIDLVTDKSSPGKEWVKVPRVVVSRRRLHLLINLLANESCKDSSFLKINTLTRRLSRVEANREYIIDELATVAEGLGRAAILDLKAVSIRLSSAAENLRRKLQRNELTGGFGLVDDDLVVGTPSSAVSLSTSNSEMKLLRVLQMLTSLCAQDDETKSEGSSVEFFSLFRSLNLESLWKQLDICLKAVSVLEGVANLDSDENEIDDTEVNDLTGEMSSRQQPKLQNSIAGLITRFLPAIEAFFMVNTTPHSGESEPASSEDSYVNDNLRVVQFAAGNKILLNALIRSNPLLLEKGLRAMIKIPKCRSCLDFDVKRAWFKSQLRRVKQQASRRHGSLRLNLRRKHVFEDSFHAFTHRNADELRGRLHVTFQDEDGVDAGGLSREFFAILAKEMFNPNYALFMSTEDGCTFQPNPNSSINPDDLRYFRFVGRIVGKAVVDGFLLDAHFTRSLYKHMLGVKPTHHDMQAIDPDYYKNLQVIMEHNLEDIGLELTFSLEDHSFGRSQTIDLIPGGRKIPVTEDSKERYVDLVCQHRMTTAIEKQIKAFLVGFHEIVDKQLISVFNARELELLISGLPDIDVHDLKKNTEYNGYRPADKEIGWFWNILFSLTRSEKAAFLQFATGSSKVPLAGFSELPGMRGVQKFNICKASGPAGALMSAHTCFNTLDLPVYNSEEEMREKLLYAINEGSSGFGFA